LLPFIGPSSLFALNAACFLGVIFAIFQWKRAMPQSRRGLESFFDSFVKAIRYIPYAPGIQIVLARNALFALFISAIPALMPVVGLKVLHLNASQLGLLFTSQGIGSVDVIMVSQGAMAIGGVIWGSAISTAGPAYSLLAAAALLLVSLVLAGPLSINFTGNLDLNPAPASSSSYKLLYTPKADDGPLSICVEFNVDSARVPEFLKLMRDVRLIHLRNGAYRWLLSKDLTGRGTYRLEITVSSWNEHLAQRERMTKLDKAVLEKAWSLHAGENVPEERIYLSLNKELRLK
jgi:hypothetical protein